MNKSCLNVHACNHHHWLTALSLVLIAIYSIIFWCLSASARLSAGLTGGWPLGSIALVASFLLIVFLHVVVALHLGIHPLDVIYRNRFKICVLIIVFSVMLHVSGSSNAIWSAFIGGEPFRGTLFGIPRAIRSDEWKVFTPFAFSQQWNAYGEFSDLVRGSTTDLSLIYAQPNFGLPSLFRPFLWGYLLFGSIGGLAFFWSARLTILFLVSVEFARFLGARSVGSSLGFGLVITFAPMIQWWFSVNGTAEILIFGQGLVLVLSSYLESRNWKRYVLAGLLVWMSLAYLLVLYPAWQVPFFWVFLICGIAVLVDKVRSTKDPHRLIEQYALPSSMALMAFLVLLLACFLPHLDVVSTVSGTSYPGQRTELGGDAKWAFSTGLSGMFTSINPGESLPNESESAGFISLIPFGCICSLCFLAYSFYRRRDPDLTSLLLALFELILIIYVLFGLPAIVAKVTLLSHSTGARVGQMLGYLDYILMFRLAVRQFPSCHFKASNGSSVSSMGVKAVLLLTIVAASLLIQYHFLLSNIRLLYIVFAVLSLGLLLTSLVMGNDGKGTVVFLASLVIALPGIYVNPVQIGADALIESNPYQAVRRLVSMDEHALWVGDDSTLGQLALSAGAKTVNSVNVYPNLDRWSSIDQKGKYLEVYNRYAHISFLPSYDHARFSLDAPDAFTVTLSLDELKRLGVKYWISRKHDLDSFSTSDAQANLVEECSNLCIWEIV